MAEYPDQIRLILKNYPYRYRDYSYLAAESLLAAGDQGKYWEMHDIMIKKSPTLDRNSLIRYAEELKLDVKQFTSDLDSMKQHKSNWACKLRWAKDTALIKALRTGSTPAKCSAKEKQQ